MPPLLLIAIPIVVAVLLIGIMTLPDEDMEETGKDEMMEMKPAKTTSSPKKKTSKKKKR